jgi:carboxymethylenebutenolidase
MEITTTTIRLRASEGEMRCHQAQPRAHGKFPAVIVMMEAFGLNDHIKDVAERIAQEGYVAIAPDLYYRESPNIVGYDQLSAAISLAQRLDRDKAIADLRSVIAHLKSQPFVNGDRIGITGFCMGGTIAFLAACKVPADIKAAVSFYGAGIAAETLTAPLSAAGALQAPILCLFGENDPYIPLSQVEKIEETLRALGKSYEIKVYPGADHGFFCDERESYHAEAAADAWERMKAWFERHLQR